MWLYTVVLNVKPARRQMCDLCVGGLKEERVRETKRDETEEEKSGGGRALEQSSNLQVL